MIRRKEKQEGLGIYKMRTEAKDVKPSIHGLTRDELIKWAIEHGEEKLHAIQIWNWLYRKRVQSSEEMANVPKDSTAALNENSCMNPLKQRMVQKVSDGVVGYLFKLPDGMLIETILMRQHHDLSVCVIPQVGRNVGCSFHASGLTRKQRNLISDEITS